MFDRKELEILVTNQKAYLAFKKIPTKYPKVILREDCMEFSIHGPGNLFRVSFDRILNDLDNVLSFLEKHYKK